MGPSPTSSLDPLAPLALPATARWRQHSQCRPALGTFVRVRLAGSRSDRELLDCSLAAFAEIDRIERLMSFHDPASELSKINREASRKPVAVSQEMRQVLSHAIWLSRLTDGLFDLTIAATLVEHGILPDPGQGVEQQASWRDLRLDEDGLRFEKPLLIDLGGIAKGFAVDRAMAVLPSDLEALIDAGGDLRLRPWRGQQVGIRLPGSRRGQLVNVPMNAPAVATSAAYFGCQIVGPQRRLAKGTHSVSVFAATCMQADALTKAAFLGVDNERFWQQAGANALVLQPDASQRWFGKS